MPRKNNLPPGAKFKKGNKAAVGHGRPRKIPSLDLLLADVLGEEQQGVTAGEIILKALRKKAFAGDVRAAELLLDRAYGKAKQQLEHTGEIQAPVVNITFSKDTIDKGRKIANNEA